MTSQRVYPRGEGGYNTSLEKTPAAHHVDEDDYGKTPEHMGKYSSIAKYKDDAAKAGDVSSFVGVKIKHCKKMSDYIEYIFL